MTDLVIYTMSPAASTTAAHPKAVLLFEGGGKITIPYAPVEVEHGGLAGDWAVLERPGRKPITRRTGLGVKTMSWACLWGYQDHTLSIEAGLEQLRAQVARGARVTLSLGTGERGWWNVTDLQIKTLARQQGSNATTRAEVSFVFTEANDVRVKIGRG